MYKTKSIAVFFGLFLMCVSLPAAAQYNPYAKKEPSKVMADRIGLYSSPGGFGISYDMASRREGEYNRFFLIADMQGLFTGEYDCPGVKFNYTRSKVVCGVGVMDFYYGSGYSTGWLRDRTSDDYGFLAAISFCCGLDFTLPRNFNIDFGIQAECGIHIRDDQGNAKVFLYQNGLLHFFYPILKLEYRF